MNSTVVANMEIHKKLLSQICRICGRQKTIRERPFVPVINLKDELHFTFLLDVSLENPEMHPELICHKCRCKAANYSAKQKGESGGGKFKNEVLVFTQHNDECCAVCDVISPGQHVSASVVGEKTSPQKHAEKATSPASTPQQENNGSDMCTFTSILENTKDLASLVKELPTELQLKLAHALGNSVSTEIYNDAISVNSHYQDTDHLIFPSTESWMSQRNPVVCAFVSSATTSTNPRTSMFQKSRKAIYAQSKAVDSMYKARYANFVSTLSFADNITLYNITGSKAAVNMNSASSAGGGMSTILTWLKSHAKKDPVVFPDDGDLFVAIDNEQVVGKTWRIYANRKVPTSVLTSVVAMRMDSKEQEHWLLPSLFSRQYSKDGLDYVTSDSLKQQSIATANTELQKYLRQRMDHVIEEQRATLTGWTDSIDEEVATPILQRKKCSKCGQLQEFEESTGKPVCKSCGSKNFKNPADDGELFAQRRSNRKRQCTIRIEPPSYTSKKAGDISNSDKLEAASKVNVESSKKHTVSGPETELHVVDPVFVNPNSYETVTDVLRHVGRCAGISKYGSGKRKWTFITMDGLPYTMAYTIIQETYTCQLCQISIFGNADNEKHCMEQHNGDQAVLDREFDWVVLRIGPGHFEMNMKKAFMELNFFPFMSDICAELGFKSANAQNYAKKCGDNHKTWDLLCIARDAFADELLRPYVLKCHDEKVPCTTTGYLNYCLTEVQNPNYEYLFEQIFVYLQAIINYRNGLRENQHDLLMAAKEMFSPIWFVRNHPRYQQIHTSDTHDRFCYPGNVENLVSANESFSLTGNPRSREGLDFVLENVNKKVKSILPHGVPNADDWLLAFRNYHELDNIRCATLTRMGMTDPSSVPSTRHRDYQEEVQKCRCLIRKSGLLDKPEAGTDFRSISGKLLHKDLMSVTAKGSKNKSAYTKCLQGGNKSQKHLPYVIVSKDEITVQSRQVTKPSLAARIEETLLRLPYGRMSDFLTVQWKEVKPRNKADYINFLETIENAEIVNEGVHLVD